MTIKTTFYKFIILGLILNSFIIYAQNTIYVNGTHSNNGDGTEQNPYNRFKTALNSAQNGDIIKLLGNTSETEFIQPDKEVEPFVIDKKVTIDGQGFTLLFRVSPLSLTQDIIFRNIRLELPPTTEKVVIDTKPIEGYNYIYANGNKVIFDRVITKIQGGHENTRPIIVAGTYKDTPDAGRAEIIIENSPSDGEGRFRAIIAGNTNTPKNTATKIVLDKNARVSQYSTNNNNIEDKGGIYFGGADNIVTAKVIVISESNYIKKYDAIDSEDNLLELVNYTSPSAPFLTNIKDLSLKSSSLFNLLPTAINRKLTIDNKSIIEFSAPDYYNIGIGNTKVTLEQMESNGGRIILPIERKIVLGENISGTLNLEIKCGYDSNCNYSEGQVFIEASENSTPEIRYSSHSIPSDFSLIRVVENGKALWKLTNITTPQIEPVNNLSHTFNQKTNTLTLSWEKPNNTNGLTGYRIHKDGDEVHNIDNIDTLTYTEVMTTSGAYEYEVIAVYNSGDSEAKSVNVDITVSPTITPSPVNNPQINFDNNSKNINITWQKPTNLEGLTGYEIYEGSNKIHSTTNIDELSFSKSITTNGTYSYDIYAIYSTQKSGAVNVNIEVSSIITPSPVNSPNITFEEATKTLKITWLKPDNLNGLTGYEIQKDGQVIQTISDANTLSFSVQISANGNYTYSIYAVYSNLKSEGKQVSTNVNTIPTTPAPTPPTNDTGTTRGRVGINTNEPKATLDIREVALNILPTGTPQGVSFPNLTTQQRETFDKAKIKEGTMIYNTTLKCLEFYNGTNWVCIQVKNN